MNMLDGKVFNDKTSLALYLKDNFRKSMTFITDESLYAILQSLDESLYEQIINLSKDFEYKENILTLIIYLLDSSSGIVTPNYIFHTGADIASEMKKCYPNVNNEIKVLFYDKVLPHIFLSEYEKTGDLRYRRNYTFMSQIHLNRMYEFTYFYFLYLHLQKNEVVRFSLDGLKMKSMREITIHLSNNLDRAYAIIEEILQNPFIMALMSIESGIEQVSAVMGSNNKLEILRLLSSYEQVDFTLLVRRKMSYWLLLNFQNYNFVTDEAKELLADYEKLRNKISVMNLVDYIAIYDEVNKLYERFLSLFNNNKYIEFKTGITGVADYYITYRYNDEYVCKKFLLDNNLFDYFIHTEVHADSIEREIIINALDEEQRAIEEFKNEVDVITENINVNKKRYVQGEVVSMMYLILVIVSLLAGLLLGIKRENNTEQLIVYGIYAIGGLSLILLFVSVIRHDRKLAGVELIELAKDNSTFSIEEINKEKNTISNPNNTSFESKTLSDRDFYKKNRIQDKAKIIKIAKAKNKVSSILLLVGTSLAIIPIFEFALPVVLELFDLELVKVLINKINFSLITPSVMLLNIIMFFILKRRNIAYYMIYAYMVILTILSVILL